MYGVKEGTSIKELINEMNGRLMERYNAEVDDMIIKGLYNGNITIPEHDLTHVKNVLLYSMYMGNKFGLSERELDILIESAKYHDTGVVNNNSHDRHSILSANIADNNLKGLYSNNDLNIIKAIIEFHEISKADEAKMFYQICHTYGITNNEDMDMVWNLGCILKDADALDRTRFPGNLNTQYFRTNLTHDMTLAAFQLREAIATQEINDFINSTTNESIKNELMNFMVNETCPRMIINFALKHINDYGRGFNSITEYIEYIMRTGFFRKR